VAVANQKDKIPAVAVWQDQVVAIVKKHSPWLQVKQCQWLLVVKKPTPQ
jgi:hypothetical protein